MNKLIASLLIGLGLSLPAITHAETTGRGIYFGLLGGYGHANSGDLRQTGTAFARPPFVDEEDIYNLPVNVNGKIKGDNFGLAGLQLGYEWGSMGFVKPSLEFEGLVLGGNQKANIKNKYDEVAVNPDTGLPVGETVLAGDHQFKYSSDMRSFALMWNGNLGFDTGTFLTPYVGAGIGFAKVSQRNAKSIQTCKFYNGEGECAIETNGPGGEVINHFNTDDRDSDYVTAAQAKLGLRAELSKNISMFAEYRYLRLSSASYKFGQTEYLNHVETATWKVKSDATDFHFGNVGLQFSF